MNVAVYTRVSTKHEEQISSLENQKKHYIEFCDKNNFNLVKLYSDEGLSATSSNRKEYLEMMYDAGLDFERDKNSNEILYFKISDRIPRFTLIITKDVSRFARNVDAIVLARKLRDKGVHVLFENAGFSTDDTDWELRLSLLLTFSQQESLDRSKKVAFAYKQRSKNGAYHMTRNLFGYQYDPITKETSIVEEEAAVVRKMFDLFVTEGYGVKSISNYLNENKIRTQNKNEWVGGNVRRLLRNDKYIGRVILNKYTNNGITSGKKKIKRPESEWIIHENAIPAIIDRETWDKAQQIIQKRANISKEGSLTGSKKVKNIFYNKLYCGCCGKPFVRISATKKRKHGTIVEINYMCANRRQRKSCNNKMIGHNKLVKEITNFAKHDLIKELEYKKQMHTSLINTQLNLLKIKLKISEKTIKQSKKEIAQIDKEIDKLLTSFSKSSSTVVAVIERKIEELEGTKFELNQKLIEYSTISIENEIEQLNNSLKTLSEPIKDDFSFEKTLKYLGKITVNDSNVKFDVVADSILEPLLNFDINKIDNNKRLKSLLEEIQEETQVLKRIIIMKNNM